MLALTTTALAAAAALQTGTPTTEPVDRTQVVETVTAACESSPGFACERIYDWTGSETLADWSAFLLNKPLKIVMILIVAAIVNTIARRAIQRASVGIATAATSADSRSRGMMMSANSAERATLRADTLGSVLRSVASVVVWSIALLMVLSELGVDLAPLIAGAGIAGVALGFGAQSLVKDILSGFFMLLEDQYGVGDVVDLGEAVGTVEKVTLRVTTVRDIGGTLWHVPNGEILRVGNKSQLWSRALLDVAVAYDADVAAACEVIKATADALWQDEELGNSIMEEPEVLGVDSLGADSVNIRLTVKTEPAAQFQIERELRARLKVALDEAGIEIPFPQRTVWLRTDSGEAAEEPEPAPA